MQHTHPDRNVRSLAAALAAGVILVACAGEPGSGDSGGGEPGAAGAAEAAASGEGAAANGAATAGTALDTGAPVFKRPAGYTELDSSDSGMRLHSYEKETEEGRIELLVFGFNNAVGGLDNNLARWAQPRDPATLTEDELAEHEVGPYVVTTLFLETAPGDEPADSAHGSVGSGKFFAYIERPGASATWTVKASGSVAAMRAEREVLEAFVQDL